jgi:hypothetical protein
LVLTPNKVQTPEDGSKKANQRLGKQRKEAVHPPTKPAEVKQSEPLEILEKDRWLGQEIERQPEQEQEQVRIPETIEELELMEPPRMATPKRTDWEILVVCLPREAKTKEELERERWAEE